MKMKGCILNICDSFFFFSIFVIIFMEGIFFGSLINWKYFNTNFILNKVHDILHPLRRQEFFLLMMILQYFKTFIIPSFDSCEKKQTFI